MATLSNIAKAAGSLASRAVVKGKAKVKAKAPPSAAKKAPLTAAKRASLVAAGAAIMGRAAPKAKATIARLATMAPVARAAAIARVAPVAPPPPAPDDAGGPPAPDGDPPEYSDDGAADPYGQDQGEPAAAPADDDPTVALPDGYLSPGADDGAPGADLAGIDYHQALEGLGDWQTDLENFATTAAENVGKQALTTLGSKLTTAGKPVVPVAPPSMFASPVVKVALGAAALGAVYLLVSRRGSSSPAAQAPAAA
jgi:hypothetical protein